MELDLQLEDRGQGAIDGSLDFSTDLYTLESASRMAGHLQVRDFLALTSPGSAPSHCMTEGVSASDYASCIRG